MAAQRNEKWDQFLDYHDRNRSVYLELFKLAIRLKNSGVEHWGMKGLFEVLRFERARLTNKDEEFKLNNLWTAYYARTLMANYESLQGFFAVRQMSDDFEPPKICKNCGRRIDHKPTGVLTSCWVCR